MKILNNIIKNSNWDKNTFIQLFEKLKTDIIDSPDSFNLNVYYWF